MPQREGRLTGLKDDLFIGQVYIFLHEQFKGQVPNHAPRSPYPICLHQQNCCVFDLFLVIQTMRWLIRFGICLIVLTL